MRCSARKSSIVALALLLSACSATQLVYNNLDWFASWKIGKYVDLEGPSKALFDSGLQSVWRWHRGTQLALYAKDLRELAGASAAPLTREQLEEYLQRVNAHSERLFQEALPEAAKVFAVMDDAQVAGLLEQMAEEREENAEEDADLSLEELQQRTIERTHKNLRRWLGSLTPEQKQRVQSWTQAHRYNPALWQQYSESWAKSFADCLSARQQAGFAEQLRILFVEPKLPENAAIEQLQTANRAAFIELLQDLSRTASDKQRKHFQSELRDLADELDELAARKLATKAHRLAATASAGLFRYTAALPQDA